MLSRRTVLGRLVGTVIGGTVAASAVAGKTAATTGASSDPRRADTLTTVHASVDASVLSAIGVPEPLAPSVAEFERSSAISLGDLTSVSGSVSFEGERLHDGWALAAGQFDVEAVTSAVQETEPQFERPAAGRSTESRSDGGAGQRATLVLEDDPMVTVSIAPSQVAVRTGEQASTPLAPQTFAPAETAAGETATQPAQQGPFADVLDGEGVVQARLGEAVRARLVSEADDASSAFRTLLRATRAGALALRPGAKRSTLRYGVIVDPTELDGTTVTRLLDELLAEEAVELIETDTDGGRIVADVAVETDALWQVHAAVLGLEW